MRYTWDTVSGSRSMNCTNGRFDPFDFSVDACQAAVPPRDSDLGNHVIGGLQNLCTTWGWRLIALA